MRNYSFDENDFYGGAYRAVRKRGSFHPHNIGQTQHQISQFVTVMPGSWRGCGKTSSAGIYNG